MTADGRFGDLGQTVTVDVLDTSPYDVLALLREREPVAWIPALDGWYVYADYCAGEVRALEVNGRSAGRDVVLGKLAGVSSVAAGPDGELYVTSVDDYTLNRIEPA